MTTAAALWAADDCTAWRAALAGYPAGVAARGERLPALDAWFRDELPALVGARTPRQVTHEELVRVTEWKMKRGVWRARNLALVRGNDPAAVEAASREAFARAAEPRAAIERLVELAGVGPATASAVLAAGEPAAFPFFDEDVAAAIPGLGPVAFTVPYYLRYAEALRGRAAALGRACPDGAWTAELVGRALWAARGPAPA
jgi:hypothetical protein